MIQRRQIITSDKIQASQDNLKVIGVFNPGAVRFENKIILLARVAETAKETRERLTASPRLDLQTQTYTIDWLSTPTPAPDPRKFTTDNGLVRLTSISRLVLIELDEQTLQIIRIHQPDALKPREHYEDFGIEDPRITQIGDTFYITYTAVSSISGITPCIMTTQDFVTFERLGIALPSQNKDVVLLPGRINGMYAAYHRPTGATRLNPLAIWYTQSPDLKHWGHHRVLSVPSFNRLARTRHIGSGPPPIKTEQGWLLLYHEVLGATEHSIGRYVLGAVVTDLHEPWRVIAQSQEWVAEPLELFETEGFTPNVIFGTGLVPNLHNPDLLQLFYGAADQSIGIMTLSISQIITNLRPC